MTLSKKTKIELLAEVKKLQRKIKLLEKEQPISQLPSKQLMLSKDKLWDCYFNNSINMITVLDKNGRILDINNNLEDGYKRDDLIGLSSYDFFDKESQLIMKKSLNEVIKTAKGRRNVLKRHRNNGETIYLSSTTTPCIKNKKVVAVIIDTYDKTNEKETENKIKKENTIFLRYAEQVPGAIFQYQYFPDGRSTFPFASEGIKDIYEVSPEEVKQDASKVFSRFYKDDFNGIFLSFKKSKTTLKDWNYEYRVSLPSKGIRWVSAHAKPEKLTDGSILWHGYIYDITERKKLEKFLIDSRKQYKDLIEGTTELIQSVSVTGKFIFVNETWKETLGYNDAEIAELNLFDIIAEESKPQCNAKFDLLVKGKSLKNIQAVFKTKDGKKLFIEGNAIPRISDGKIIGSYAFLKNVTEAKKAEEEKKYLMNVLQKSEDKFRSLFENAPDPILIVDDKRRFINCNEATVKALGASSKYQIINKFLEGISPKYQPDGQLSYIKSKTMGLNAYKKGLAKFEWVHQRFDGSIIYSEVSLTVISEENKKFWLMSWRDITDRKKMETFLKMEEQNMLLTRYAELVPGLLFQYQVFPDGKYMFPFANKGIWDIFEVTPDEVRQDASKAFSRLYKDDVDNVLSLIKESMTTLKNWSYEFRVNLPSKGIRWLMGNAKPEKLANGSVLWHGYITDITERKIITEQINQSLQEKEVLLKEVHHRVKNNLQVISSMLNLQSSYVKDKTTFNALRESQDRIKSMAIIHESLYKSNDFSNIDFSEYVKNLLQNLLQSYSKSNQTIKLNLNIQTVFLNLDLAILCGLIINEIISNALKYAFIDTKEGEMTITMQTEGEKIRLVIEDNGMGLPKHIDYKNTESLGLQLVVTLVDQLNGSIELENIKGTKYTILFRHILPQLVPSTIQK